MIARRIFMRAGVAVAEATYITSAENAANQSSYTFSSQPIGAAASNRVVVICITGNGGAAGTATVTGVTVGGNSCTKANDVLDNECAASIWYVSLASGTTADVVVTWTGAKGDCGIAIYTVLTSTATPSVTYSASAAAPISVSATFGAGSAVIGSVAWSYGGSDPLTTWANLTEDDDTPVESGQVSSSCASDNFAAAQTSLSIQAAPSLSTTNEALVVAVWGP